MGVLFLLILGACASRGGAPAGTGAAGVAPGTPVAVTDVKAVVGRWVGLLDLPGNQERQAYLEVTVQEDGRYQAKAARTIGILDAQGTIAVHDGGLVLQGARGSHGTARLFTLDGRPTLMVEMMTPNQERTTVRLRPER